VRLAGIDYAWVYPGPVIGLPAAPALAYPLTGEFGGEAGCWATIFRRRCRFPANRSG